MPLAFTNIVSVKKQNGTSTDVKGIFHLDNFDMNDTLKITNIAYHSKLVVVKTLLKNDTIFLNESIKTLDEVTITNFNNLKTEQDLGYLNFKTNASFDLKPVDKLPCILKIK